MGCGLGDFTTTGFALWVGAEKNSGFFDPDWPSLAALEPHISRARLREVLESHFLYDFAQFKAAAAETAQPNRDLRRHEFNPLTSRPFVTLPDGRHVAPQPKLVIQKLSPSTLYYAGISQLEGKDKSSFTEDFGIIFEHYVGRQLAVLPGALPHVEHRRPPGVPPRSNSADAGRLHQRA